MHDDIAWMPATEMAAAIRAKKLSPVEVTKALLDRIEKINPSVNAYCLVTSEMALKQAEEAEVAVARATNSGRCTACRSRSRISSMCRGCRRRRVR